MKISEKWKQVKDAASALRHAVTTPTAYSWYAIAGVIGTAVLTVIATKKIYDICQEEPSATEEDSIETKEERIRQKVETLKKVVPVAAPPILTTALTIACIRKSNTKSIEIIEKLTEYAQMEASRVNYFKEKTIGKLPGAATAAVAADMLKDHEKLQQENPDDEYDMYGNKRVWMYDEFSKTHVKASIAEFYIASQMVDQIYGSYGYCGVNDFYTIFGIDQLPKKNYCGWDCENGYDWGYYYVGIQLYKPEDSDEYIISFPWDPEPNRDTEDYYTLQSYDSPFYGMKFTRLPTQYRESENCIKI